MIGVASGTWAVFLLFRGEHPFDELKKRRKQLLGSNWK